LCSTVCVIQKFFVIELWKVEARCEKECTACSYHNTQSKLESSS